MDLRRFESREELARAGAEIAAREAREAVRRRGIFTLVIPGGRSPRTMFARMAADRTMPWSRTHVFWGDERCLPPDHPQSNVRQGRELLTVPAGIPEDNVHPPRLAEPPARMAEEYRKDIEEFFRRRRLPPVFDLVLLGMGADGHVASIFPEETRTAEKETVFATSGAKASPPVPRISLGFPAILSARRIILMAPGPEKNRVLSGMDRGIPAVRVAAAPRAMVLASP